MNALITNDYIFLVNDDKKKNSMQKEVQKFFNTL